MSLNIDDYITQIGHVRHKFITMASYIEAYDYDGAKKIYEDLLSIKYIISSSPYYIEFQIYTLLYNTFVKLRTYDELKDDIKILDKISDSLSNDLKSTYFLVTGHLIINTKFNEEGLRRLKCSLKIKETSWINYTLGNAYCLSNSSSKGTYYLENHRKYKEANNIYIYIYITSNEYLKLDSSHTKLYNFSKYIIFLKIYSIWRTNYDKKYI